MEKPEPPGDKAGLAEIKLCKLNLKEHHKKLKTRKADQEKTCSLVLGQCSRTIRDPLEADSNWNAVDATSDLMALLSLIRQCLHNSSTTRQPTHTLIDAQSTSHKVKQGKR